MVPVALGRWLGRSGLMTKHWRFNPSTQAAFQAQAVMGFYDTWVARSYSSLFLLTNSGLYSCIGLVHGQGSYCNGVIESCRDSDGNLFLKDSPYVTDPYSLERIAQGLPFPVKCCWNGLVAMRAEPFSKHHLRVR